MQYKWKGHKIQETIRAILEDSPRLSEEYSNPGEEEDCVYRPEVVHPAACGESCENWPGLQPVQLVERRR